ASGPAKTTAKTPVGAASKATGPVDLNTASQEELESLKGVGPATAKKIIGSRPYASAQDLKRAGLSDKLIASLGPGVTVAKAGAGAAGAAAGAATGPAPGGAAGTVTPAPSASSAAPKSAPVAKTAPAGQAEVTAQTPPQKGMVWGNTDSGILHKEGTRWFG